MPKSRGLYGLLLWGALLATAAAFEADLPKEIPDEPFEILAPRLEYTNDTFIASGGVTGRFENVVIRADTISGSPETGDLHADGDIRFERGNVIWQGSELDYNFIKQEGLFGPSALYFEPAFLSVDHVERISTNEYLLRGATFTTCPEDSPHIHARAEEARLVDEKYIKAKGVVFYVGKVPVFYVPYWRHKLREGIFTFKMGMGSEWGAYALTKATLPITENVDYITDINLYSKRGVGIGQGFSWEYPQAVGEFAAFYLKDQNPHERFTSPEIGSTTATGLSWNIFRTLRTRIISTPSGTISVIRRSLKSSSSPNTAATPSLKTMPRGSMATAISAPRHL